VVRLVSQRQNCKALICMSKVLNRLEDLELLPGISTVGVVEDDKYCHSAGQTVVLDRSLQEFGLVAHPLCNLLVDLVLVLVGLRLSEPLVLPVPQLLNL